MGRLEDIDDCSVIESSDRHLPRNVFQENDGIKREDNRRSEKPPKNQGTLIQCHSILL